MYLQLHISFNQTKHQHKWLVTHLNFNDKLDTLYYEFTAGESRSGSDVSYQAEVGMAEVLMSSAAWRIKSNYGTHYIKGGGVVSDKP